MRNVHITHETISKLAPYHRRFQTAIAIRANEILGSTRPPDAAKQYEGGVKVGDGYEIIITRGWPGACVERTYATSGTATKEEEAVATAMEEVAAKFEKEGPNSLPEPAPLRGDSLNHLFDLNPYNPQ